MRRRGSFHLPGEAVKEKTLKKKRDEVETYGCLLHDRKLPIQVVPTIKGGCKVD